MQSPIPAVVLIDDDGDEGSDERHELPGFNFGLCVKGSIWLPDHQFLFIGGADVSLFVVQRTGLNRRYKRKAACFTVLFRQRLINHFPIVLYTAVDFFDSSKKSVTPLLVTGYRIKKKFIGKITKILRGQALPLAES